MQNTATATALTPIEAAVLECIVYGDLFDFALTAAEVHRWLALPAARDEVDAALAGENLVEITSRSGPYVMLQGREETAAVRERRARSSAGLRRQAERYGGLIGRLPFVRMVAVTGSLAVDNADEGDDLDYLVVTAPGRVWLARTMIMAVGRVARLRGVTLCPNYVLAETALALPGQDYYTARELLQMQPVAGRATYERMLELNGWWREYLPNAPHPAPSPISEMRSKDAAFAGSLGGSVAPVTEGRAPTTEGHAARNTVGSAPTTVRPELVEGRGTPVICRRSPSRRISEAVLGLPPFDAVERWIYARKGAELRRQAGGAEVVFDETMCKGHFDRWRERTQQRLRERVQQVLESAR